MATAEELQQRAAEIVGDLPDGYEPDFDMEWHAVLWTLSHLEPGIERLREDNEILRNEIDPRLTRNAGQTGDET